MHLDVLPCGSHLRHAAGLKRPTLIQRHAVPIVGHQEHYDLVAQAQTGTNSSKFVVHFRCSLLRQIEVETSIL